MNLVRGGRTAAFCGGLRSVNILMQENICDELLKHRTVDQLREHWTFEKCHRYSFGFCTIQYLTSKRGCRKNIH